MEFHTAATKTLEDVTKVNHVFKNKPVNPHEPRDTYPIYCSNGKDKYILQLFDDGQQVNISPFKDDQFQFQNIIPFENKYKTKQHRKFKSFAHTFFKYGRQLNYGQTLKNTPNLEPILNAIDLEL